MARPFLNERISLDVRYGTSFVEKFNTIETEDAGGSGYSKLINPFPRLYYELNFANCKQDDLANDLYDLYMRSGGMHGGFLVRHHAQYTTNNYRNTPTHTDQKLISLGDNKFQLVVWFGLQGAGPTPRRLIRKPVTGTVKVGVGGVLVTTGFAIDYATGVITFSGAPSGDVTAGCEFDIPVRFGADYSGAFTSFEIISANLSVVEILNP